MSLPDKIRERLEARYLGDTPTQNTIRLVAIDGAEALWAILMVEHEKWCPHFHVEYQDRLERIAALEAELKIYREGRVVLASGGFK